jgi:phosphatidylglycerol---prolipoprotein diacylglyceryl transferase
MRQILFQIPLNRDWDLGPLGTWPGFGFGLLLGIWAIVSVFMIRREWKAQKQFNNEVVSAIVYSVVVSALIVLLPRFVTKAELDVYGYGMMLVVAVFASGKVASTMGKKIGVDPQFTWDLTVKLILAGVVGARLFYLIQYHERVFKDCRGLGDMFAAAVRLPDGGLVLYGGLIFAALTGVWMCYRNNIPRIKYVDALVPAVFVGIACGRIGCFLNGCCYGDPCELPWAVTFPQGSVPWSALAGQGFIAKTATESLSLHPTQIYSSLNALILAWLTASYYKHRSGDGAVIALGLMTYSISRTCIEILRGDELGQFGTGFTISQWISFGVFLLGAAFFWWSWTQSKTRLTSDVPDVSAT